MSTCLVLPWRTKLNGLSLTTDACVVSTRDLLYLAVVSWEISVKSDAHGGENICKMEDFLESSIYDLLSNCWRSQLHIETLACEQNISKGVILDSLKYEVYRRVGRLRSILEPTLNGGLVEYLLLNNLSIELAAATPIGLVLYLVEYPCR